MSSLLLIGFGAGLVSAVLFASAATGTVLGVFFLFFLSPLPVAMAGLGWGWRAAAVASGCAALFLALFSTPRASAFYLLAVGAATVHLSYQALLNRAGGPARAADGRPNVEWYPVGRMVTAAALWAGGLAAAALLAVASDADELRAVLKAAFDQLVSNKRMPLPPGMDGTLSEKEITAIVELMAASFNAVTASTWMVFALVNLWLAGLVTLWSKRLVRPWPDLASLALPRGLSLVLAAALAPTLLSGHLTFLSGYPGMIAAGFASALLLAYGLVGLAILHTITRGLTWRPLILGAVYALLFVPNPLAGPLIVLLGLSEAFIPMRRPPPRGSNTT